jgi:hypothetical protein
VGNALVQQQGLFAFAIAQSGVEDLVGHERTANGQGQAPEVGSSRKMLSPVPSAGSGTK